MWRPQHILKYDFGNRLLVACRSPDLRDLQARLRDEGPPLAIGALQPLCDGQHVDVYHGMSHGAPLIGKDIFVDQDLRGSTGHGRSRVAEDSKALVIVPVVEDEVEEVCTCP